MTTPHRGRPVTGTARTATERGAAADKALTLAGGRILSRVRLSLEATVALGILEPRAGSIRAAIEQALLVAATNARSPD